MFAPYPAESKHVFPALNQFCHVLESYPHNCLTPKLICWLVKTQEQLHTRFVSLCHFLPVELEKNFMSPIIPKIRLIPQEIPVPRAFVHEGKKFICSLTKPLLSCQ